MLSNSSKVSVTTVSVSIKRKSPTTCCRALVLIYRERCTGVYSIGTSTTFISVTNSQNLLRLPTSERSVLSSINTTTYAVGL